MAEDRIDMIMSNQIYVYIFKGTSDATDNIPRKIINSFLHSHLTSLSVQKSIVCGESRLKAETDLRSLRMQELIYTYITSFINALSLK